MGVRRVAEVTKERVGVFVTFLSKEPRKVYKDNPDLNGKPIQNADVYELLICSRHDCRFGFIGGFKEAGESLEDAVIREVSEEINNPEITEIVREALTKGDYDMIVHSNGRMDFVLFVIKVDDIEKIASIICQKVFYNNPYKEIIGVQTIPIYELKYLPEKVRERKDRGLYRLFDWPFATSVKEEIACILKEILPEKDFTEIVTHYANISEDAYTIVS